MGWRLRNWDFFNNKYYRPQDRNKNNVDPQMTRKTQILWCAIQLLILALTASAFHPMQQGISVEDRYALPIYRDRVETLLSPQALFGEAAVGWTGRRTDGPEISFQATGRPFQIAGPITSAGSAATAAKFYLLERKTAWGMSNEFDLNVLSARKVRQVWFVGFQQTINGIPIYGSRVDAKLTNSGRLSALVVRLFPASAPVGNLSLSVGSALRRLTSDPTASVDFSQVVYFPKIEDRAISLRPALFLRTTTASPEQRPAGIVDALTGEILLRYNDVAFDAVWGNVTGLVLPAYWNDPPQAWPQKNQWVNVIGGDTIYTDASGDYVFSGLQAGSYPVEGMLYGLYVDVDNADGPDAYYSDTASTASALDWTWDYDLGRQDEINVYYHTDLVHHFFKSLDSDFTDLDFPLPATVGYGTNYENAFWNGSGMFFGAGGMAYRNFALFCDVIYHEYGHGVTDMIYPPGMLPYVSQPGAMNEGWSDYFACTITDEPMIGEGGLMVSNGVMRNLDNTLRYPENWVGEVHADGRIFGGALWDLRERVGAGTADTIIHFAKYALAEMWEDYFVDVLVTDDDDGDLTNGGPHHPEIYESFGLHGIGPGIEPILTISLTEVLENGQGGSLGNGDGFYDPGEILSMTFSVSDTRYLYPPPAQDVTVTPSSESPHLIMQPQVYSLGDIAPGATVQAPESLLITVTPQAPLSYAHIIFQISANGGSYQTSDTIEIIVGHPQIVLVDDDNGASYQQYPYNALRAWGQVLTNFDVAAQGSLSLNQMEDFDVLIWMTGNDSESTLTEEDQTNLAQYLDGGGNLLLTGQNLVEDIGPSAFFADYLKCAPLLPDLNAYILDGVSGDPISDSTWLLIVGAGGASNQTSPAAIAALPGAVEIYHYQTDSLHRPAAVRYDNGTYKVVTFAFGCEAISGLGGSTNQANLLSSVLNWFGLQTAVEPEPLSVPLPEKFSLGHPFPNPFNAQVTIPLSLPAKGRLIAEIYNLRGERIEKIYDGAVNAGIRHLPWDGAALPSGLYFVKVALMSDDNRNLLSGVSKIVLLK